MRIENITLENIKHVPVEELHNLRIRFIDIFDRYFTDPAVRKAVDIDRQTFYEKYTILRAEMTGRGMKFFWNSLLDKNISNRIFKSSMWDLDVPAMGEVAIVPEYVSVGGSFIKSPKDAEDIDIIIRDSEENRDESFELKVGRLIKRQTKKEPHFVYAPKGPHSSYIPLFDLVLRAREETKKVNVKETVRKKLILVRHKKRYAKAERELNLKDFEYLIHHVAMEGDEEIVHHCHMYDHIGNLFEQAHLYFDKGKVYLDGKEIKEGHYHVIKGLEPKQEVAWSEEEATKAGIKPKGMMSGMTLKEKAKAW